MTTLLQKHTIKLFDKMFFLVQQLCNESCVKVDLHDTLYNI